MTGGESPMFGKRLGRKSLLAIAIAVSLSGTAFAMPQGGQIAAGTINNKTSGAIAAANGGTINVNQTGVINWNSFNMAKGESLKFALGENSLLNRVTGGNLSTLAGTINATGNGGLFIVNPAGITVADGAVFNANNMVLSTLDITPRNFMSNVNKEDGLLSFAKSANAANGKLTFSVGKVQLNVKDFMALGGEIEVADGVTISNSAETSDASFLAVNEADVTFLNTTDTGEEHGFSYSGTAASTDNTMTLGSMTYAPANSEETTDTNFEAGAITLNGTTIKTNGRIGLSAGQGLTNTEEESKYISSYSADSDNTLSLTHANLTAGSMDLMAGKVDMSDSSMYVVHTSTTDGSYENNNLHIYAVGTFKDISSTDSDGNEVETYEITTAAENSVNMKHSFADTKGDLRILGNTITSESSAFTTDGFDLIAANTYNANDHFEASLYEADPFNLITFKGQSSIRDISTGGILGGQVDIGDTELKTGYLYLMGLNSITWDSETDEEPVYKASGKNLVSIKDSRLEMTADDNPQGGTIYYGGTEIEAGSVLVDNISLFGEADIEAGNTFWNDYTSDAGNTIQITNSSITNAQYIGLQGYSVNVSAKKDGTALANHMQMKMNPADENNSAGDFEIAAVSSYRFIEPDDPNQSGTEICTAGADNTITIDGTNSKDGISIEAGKLKLVGGNINLKNADFHAKKGSGDINKILAVSSLNSDGNGPKNNVSRNFVKAGTGNNLSLTNTQIETDDNLFLGGADISMTSAAGGTPSSVTLVDPDGAYRNRMKGHLRLAAANGYDVTGMTVSNLITAPSNELTLSGASASNNVELSAADTKMYTGKTSINYGDLETKKGNFELYAGNIGAATSDLDLIVKTAAGNDVKIQNSTIDVGNSLRIEGYTVGLANAHITTGSVARTDTSGNPTGGNLILSAGDYTGENYTSGDRFLKAKGAANKLTVEGSNLDGARRVFLDGGTISVKDSQLSTRKDARPIDLLAGKDISYASIFSNTSTSANTVTVDNSTLSTAADGTRVRISGYSISMNDPSAAGSGETTIHAGTGKMDFLAASSVNGDSFTTTVDNSISLNSLTTSGKSIRMISGKTGITGSDIYAADGGITMNAVNFNGSSADTRTSANVIDMKNTKVHTTGTMYLKGSRISLDASHLVKDKAEPAVTTSAVTTAARKAARVVLDKAVPEAQVHTAGNTQTGAVQPSTPNAAEESLAADTGEKEPDSRK